jgi:hypothetical protein
MNWLAPRLTARTATVGLSLYLIVAGLAAQIDDGFTPIGPRFSFPSLGYHQQLQTDFTGFIPSGVPVSTQDQLDPHLADRHYLYLFEDTGGPPDPPTPRSRSILLDVSEPTYPLPSFELYNRAQQYLRRSQWGVRVAADGLILIQRGGRRKVIPPAFYTYLLASSSGIQHALSGSERGLAVDGYSVQRTDMTNHRVPSMAYTIYFHAAGRMRQDLQPVIFKILGNSVDCQGNALGLDWLPTSRWSRGQSYAVRLQPIETFAAAPGTAQFFLALEPAATVERMLAHPPYSCTPLWNRHGRLWDLGTLNVTV